MTLLRDRRRIVSRRPLVVKANLEKQKEIQQISNIIEVGLQLSDLKQAAIREIASLRMKSEQDLALVLSQNIEAAKIAIQDFSRRISQTIEASIDGVILDSKRTLESDIQKSQQLLIDLQESLASLQEIEMNLAEQAKKTPVLTPEQRDSIVMEVSNILTAKEDAEDSSEEEDSPSMIEKIVEEVLSKKELTVNDIKGLDAKLAEIRRAHALYGGTMRGGGDTVAAGSGISVARNSDGQTVITNTSTSGLTELTATETPDGATTVFTFAAATAQPSYIISDNVWMKATTKSGTVNWTWNNGTKKATLTIPPSDEIYALV